MKSVKKPWGEFIEFTDNEPSTVKILIVMPKQELSLQYHKKRDEMWYFLTDGYCQIKNKKYFVRKGNIVNVKKGIFHRLYSKSKKVEVLEISFGKFDENDIVRVEDKYNRIKPDK